MRYSFILPLLLIFIYFFNQGAESNDDINPGAEASKTIILYSGGKPVREWRGRTILLRSEFVTFTEVKTNQTISISGTLIITPY